MPIKDGAQVSLSVQDLSKVRITEFQPRYPERLQHYIGILEEHPHDHLGVLLLKPSTDGYFEILDGHHRFLAYVMTGRQFALALTVDERNIDEQAADDQRDLEALRAKLSAPPRTESGEAGSSDLRTDVAVGKALFDIAYHWQGASDEHRETIRQLLPDTFIQLERASFVTKLITNKE